MFVDLRQSSSSLSFLIQLVQRKDVCEHRATVARNDYLLNTGATNAHQQLFYGVDLPQLMKVGLKCTFVMQFNELSRMSQSQQREKMAR